MEIGRIYAHRAYGEVGNVVLECDLTRMTLNGNDIPELSMRAILRHGLQILQDAYAGAKSTDEAKAFFAKKLDKLLNGTLGERGVSDEMSDRDETIARKWIAFKGMTFAKGTLLPEKLEKAFTAWEADATPAKALIQKQAEAFLVSELDRKEREAAELREMMLAMGDVAKL